MTFKCQICDKLFGTTRGLNVHKRLAHKVNNNNNNNDLGAARDLIINVDMDKICFKCPNCDRLFVQNFSCQSLFEHVFEAHGLAKVKCELCEKRFCGGNDLYSHFRTVHLNHYFECDICEFGSAQKGVFQTHMKINHGNKGRLNKGHDASFPDINDLGTVNNDAVDLYRGQGHFEGQSTVNDLVPKIGRPKPVPKICQTKAEVTVIGLCTPKIISSSSCFKDKNDLSKGQTAEKVGSEDDLGSKLDFVSKLGLGQTSSEAESRNDLKSESGKKNPDLDSQTLNQQVTQSGSADDLDGVTLEPRNDPGEADDDLDEMLEDLLDMEQELHLEPRYKFKSMEEIRSFLLDENEVKVEMYSKSQNEAIAMNPMMALNPNKMFGDVDIAQYLAEIGSDSDFGSIDLEVGQSGSDRMIEPDGTGIRADSTFGSEIDLIESDLDMAEDRSGSMDETGNSALDLVQLDFDNDDDNERVKIEDFDIFPDDEIGIMCQEMEIRDESKERLKIKDESISIADESSGLEDKSGGIDPGKSGSVENRGFLKFPDEEDDENLDTFCIVVDGESEKSGARDMTFKKGLKPDLSGITTESEKLHWNNKAKENEWRFEAGQGEVKCRICDLICIGMKALKSHYDTVHGNLYRVI